MSMQVSNIGLAFIAGINVLSIVVLIAVWRATPKARRKIAIFAPIAVLILAVPWADEIWIAYRFSKLCREAGVHIVRKVNVEVFLDATNQSSASGLIPTLITDPIAIKQFEQSGYRFQERALEGGKVWHLERARDGIQAAVLEKPTARYNYKFPDLRQEVPVALRVGRRETIVVDSETDDVIGREVTFGRYPGWVESLWIRFFGSGQITCRGAAPASVEGRQLLYRYVLIPAALRG